MASRGPVHKGMTTTQPTTKGEMTMTSYSVSIEWDTLHSLAAALERARRGMAEALPFAADPFGGSYCGEQYERSGLAGGN